MTAFIEALLQLAGVAVLTLGGFAIHRLSDWLKLRADDQVRTYLLATLDRAVEFGKAEARRRIRDGAAGSHETLAAELARQYTLDRVPDALARFGVGTPGLDQMIQARMPKPPAILGGAP